MFAQALNVRGGTTLRFDPVRGGVISWNTLCAGRDVALSHVCARATPASAWYDYAQWQTSGRKSFSPTSDRDGINVDVDVLRAEQPFDGIELLGDEIDFNLLAFAAPSRPSASLPYARDAMILDVPARSQYVLPRGARLVQRSEPLDGQRVPRDRSAGGRNGARACSTAPTTAPATGRSTRPIAAVSDCARRSPTCKISIRRRA